MNKNKKLIPKETTISPRFRCSLPSSRRSAVPVAQSGDDEKTRAGLGRVGLNR